MMQLMNEMTNQLSRQLNDKLELILIEGLKIKGFEFSDRRELEIFVQRNVRCEDQIRNKERTYFVYETPFLLHKYEVEMDLSYQESGGTKMTANYGKYTYL